MKIAVISDLHYGNNVSVEGSGPFNSLDHRKFATLVHAEKPDVLLLAGDVGETCIDESNLDACLEIYKNPHGPSLCIPGNHDMWLSRRHMEAGLGWQVKYEWFFNRANKMGWTGMKDEPAVIDDVWFVGNMGWYDFSMADPLFNRAPETWDYDGDWSDFGMMRMRSALGVCRDRMAELTAAFLKVPKERKALVAMTHIVGFNSLMSDEFRRPDHGKGFMGNVDIGTLMERHEVDLYVCGHTHRRKIETKTLPSGKTQLRLNNGSGYGRGSKRCDLINIDDKGVVTAIGMKEA